jgi:hypothetical protein
VVPLPELSVMRILRAVAAAIAVFFIVAALTAPTAQAQGMGRGHRRQSSPDASASAKTNKADERAYRDALKGIPDKKVDPWGNIR